MSKAIKKGPSGPIETIATPKEKTQYLVGIGASAGGLRALKTFLANLAATFNHPMVLVQHLLPKHDSHMRELLKNHTHYNLVEVKSPMPVKSGNLYLMMPDTTIMVENGMIIPKKRDHTVAISQPIDIFFSSLGLDYQERSIGIILSGTGTDGSSGILSISEFGGKILVQSPNDAEFNGMPLAAMATDTANAVLPAEQIGIKLLQFTEQNQAGLTLEQEILLDVEGFGKILLLLKLITGIDFTGYKKSTLVRRIVKRMQHLKIETLGTYFGQLEKDHKEAHWLGNDFLIGVTSFFRDPDVWRMLEEQVIPNILSNKADGDIVKINSVGCSTGEEAYSLAMILWHQIEESGKNISFRIFCCDLSRERIEKASKGTYPKKVLQDIPQKYHSLVTVGKDGFFNINTTLRHNMVFSNYDYLNSTPMNKMDMVLCRNLLIYLDSKLQQKITKMFRFSLNNKGYLILGRSESFMRNNRFFSTIDEHLSIYRNTSKEKFFPETGKHHIQAPYMVPYGADAAKANSEKSFNFLPNLLNNSLIEELDLAVIYVDDHGNIQKAAGGFRQYLQLPKTGFSNNIFDLLPLGFTNTLRSAMETSKREEKKTKIENIRLPQMAKDEALHLVCWPHHTDNKRFEQLLVFFPQRAKPLSSNAIEIPHVIGSEKDSAIKALNEDLKAANLTIASLTNQIDVSTEELQTSNEELMATNEELQSTNEELQSVNEELYAVNAELSEKIKLLTKANDDVDNLLDSANIDVLLLDKELCIRKYTPTINKHFEMGQLRIGSPLYHYKHRFDRAADDLIALCIKTVEEGEEQRKEVQNLDGQWYLQQLAPFINSKGDIDGAIVSYINITEMKLLYQSNRELERFAYLASHDLQEPLRNILDFIGVFKTEYETDFDANAQTYLTYIEEATQRMKQLIQEILAYSRLGTKGVGASVDLNHTVDKVLQDLSGKIKDAGAKVEVVGNLPTLVGHETELYSLFLNLIGNALKFGDQKRKPVIRISTSKKDGDYLFSMADNGIGIKPKYLDKVFEVFKRFHDSTEYQGTGIGLAHCKKIVELHGGKIWVESKVNVGSTFYFTLNDKQMPLPL